MEATAALYLALPAFAANMAPIIAARWRLLKRLNRPLDGGYSWRTRRIFGANKTYRGLIAGTAAGAVIATIQWKLPWFREMLPFTNMFSALVIGALGGFGALLGDATASFAKRQLSISEGKPWIPFDYIDYIAGFVLFTSGLYSWNWLQITILFVFTAIANPIVNITAYALGIKNTSW